MNEKIKELAEQAGLKQRIWNSLGKELPMWQEDPDNPWLEKFAELIVRECISVINQPNGVGDDDVIKISRDVKKHFGVEE